MIASALFFTVLCLLLSYVYKYAVKVYRAQLLTSSIPGWFNVPFLGSAHKFFGNTEYLFKIMEDICLDMHKETGRFRLWLGPQLIIVTTSPKDIRAINNAFIERPYYFGFAKPWLGDGLITAPGELWKKNIKKLGIAFSGSVVEGFQTVYNTQSEKLIRRLKIEDGGEPFDIFQKYLAQSTLETICQTALGVTDLDKNMISSEYFNAFQKALDLVVARSMNIFHHSDIVYKYTSNHKELMKSIKVLQQLSNDIIADKRKACYDNLNKGIPPPEGKFRAFLDILMELSGSEHNLTNEQIQAEVDTIIASGQETTALGLFYVLRILASYKPVQDKLYAEIKEVFGDSNRSINKEDLDRLTYCDAVLNETLRLYPPILFAMRDIHKDLELDGCTLPKGAICFLPMWVIGRSTANFGEDALQFNPDRWLDNSSPKSPATSPFSYGRRPCIGRKYAMALMKTVITYCVREYEFTSDGPELDLKADLTLRPKSGHLVMLRTRKSILKR